MGTTIFKKNKLLLLVLSGIGAGLFWKVGAMTNTKQKCELNPGESQIASDGYGQNKDASGQKCCDTPPSKSALMLAR